MLFYHLTGIFQFLYLLTVFDFEPKLNEEKLIQGRNIEPQFRLCLITTLSDLDIFHSCTLSDLDIFHSCNLSAYRRKPCIGCRNLPLKGFLGMAVQIIYYDRFWVTFSKICRMWQYRYFRSYWLGSSSAYPTYCSDFGTISLLYLCMNSNANFWNSLGLFLI